VTADTNPMDLDLSPADKRGRILDMLRHAGDAGVSAAAFYDGGITYPWVHIESLVFEGHVIVQHTLAIRDQSNNRDVARRWFLRKDIWT
jgi:hypothetical protein